MNFSFEGGTAMSIFWPYFVKKKIQAIGMSSLTWNTFHHNLS